MRVEAVGFARAISLRTAVVWISVPCICDEIALVCLASVCILSVREILLPRVRVWTVVSDSPPQRFFFYIIFLRLIGFDRLRAGRIEEIASPTYPPPGSDVRLLPSPVTVKIFSNTDPDPTMDTHARHTITKVF